MDFITQSVVNLKENQVLLPDKKYIERKTFIDADDVTKSLVAESRFIFPDGYNAKQSPSTLFHSSEAFRLVNRKIY